VPVKSFFDSLVFLSRDPVVPDRWAYERGDHDQCQRSDTE
jgi:hypothetical protein